MEEIKAAGANFYAADFTYADVNKADMRGTDMRKARMKNIKAWDVDFSGANFEETNFAGCGFQRSNLNGANLQRTQSYAFFDRCSFQNADLRGADLTQYALVRKSSVRLRAPSTTGKPAGPSASIRPPPAPFSPSDGEMPWLKACFFGSPAL